MKYLAIFAFLSAALTSQAQAQQVPDLVRFLDESVSTYDPAVSESTSTSELIENDQESWYFRNFWLRLRPKFTIEVPWVAKFQVIPEVELLWQRALPEGYSNYKP